MLHIFNRKPIHSILIIFHSIITREKISSSRKINTIHNFLLIKFNIKCKLIAKFIFTIFYITRLRLILISKIRDRTQPIQFARGKNESISPPFDRSTPLKSVSFPFPRSIDHRGEELVNAVSGQDKKRDTP